MDHDDSYRVDLWGNQIYRRVGKKGRPPFERTDENASKINMLLACGWSNARIADCVIDPRTGKSISVPTLKRHFRAELQERDVARDRLFAKRIGVTADVAFDGNIGAMRLLNLMIEKNDLMITAAKFRDNKEEQPEALLGKKEIERRKAKELVENKEQGTWGSDLTPGGFH